MSFSFITPLPGRVYHAVAGFEDHLIHELGGPETGMHRIGENLFHDPGPSKENIFWWQNCWTAPFRLEFSSINEAANALRAVQRNWAACLHTQFRRGALIESKLPPISKKRRSFPRLLNNSLVEVPPMGAWTLLDANTMIASAVCSSPFPNGLIEFEEDKHGPPGRAYLKLWEALTRMGAWPEPGCRCLDAGASPGSWTWALAKLGANVTAVDRASLEDRIARLPGVEFIRHDAFTLKPEDTGPVDWLFCDVACYPPKLLTWVEKWLASGLCRNYVCTIKMQGNIGGNVDFDTPKLFAGIPGSKVVHLYHNKHELTWMKQMKNEE